MDENDFKKHLKDLAHGHHHPEEHDWGGDGEAKAARLPDRGADEVGHKPKEATMPTGRPAPKKSSTRKATKR